MVRSIRADHVPNENDNVWIYSGKRRLLTQVSTMLRMYWS